MKRFAIFLLLLTGTAALRAELPPLIPREVLFGNPERADPQISPDGAQISWLAPNKNGVLNIWASGTDGANPHPITNEAHRPVHWYFWVPDGKHILYLHDNDGDEIASGWPSRAVEENCRINGGATMTKAMSSRAQSRDPAAHLNVTPAEWKGRSCRLRRLRYGFDFAARRSE